MLMTPKERVYAGLLREKTDRVPMWMWYHPAVYDRLLECFGWDTATADERLGNDIKQVHISINREMSRPLSVDERFVDDWGVGWIREGLYNQVVENPLAGADASALPYYKFPSPDDPERYEPLARLCERYGEEYFIGADVSGCIFEPCYHIRGMENLLVDMIVNPDEVGEFFDNAMDFTRQVCLHALEHPVDWIWLGDDVGGQSAMMLSPGQWRVFLKPRLHSIISAVKKVRPGIFVAYHSCGAISDIIPDLIEIGVDVLNPIQPLCVGMEPFELKAQFGNRVAFMGGLDTQKFLITAKPYDVHQRARQLVEAMSAGGGYIFAASHTIQPDVPIDNILALAEAIVEADPSFLNAGTTADVLS